MPIFLENFTPFSREKIVYPGSHFALITLTHSINQRRKLVRVGMYLQNECM